MKQLVIERGVRQRGKLVAATIYAKLACGCAYFGVAGQGDRLPGVGEFAPCRGECRGG